MTDYSDFLDGSAKGATLMSVKKKLQDRISEQEDYVSGGRKVSTEEGLVKVKSNYARDKVVIIGDFNAKFNSDGIAKIPPHVVSDLQKLMKVRPGRFTIVEDPKKQEEEKVQSVVKETVPAPVLETELNVPSTEVEDTPKKSSFSKKIAEEETPSKEPKRKYNKKSSSKTDKKD